MTGRDFYDRVNAHPELEWLGVVCTTPRLNGAAVLTPVTGPSEKGGGSGDSTRRLSAPPIIHEALVRHTGTEKTRAMPLAEIGEHDWNEIETALLGGVVLWHVSRIVGYFSRRQNWNRSKLAEDRDRRAGAYALPEAGSRRGFAMKPVAGGEKG